MFTEGKDGFVPLKAAYLDHALVPDPIPVQGTGACLTSPEEDAWRVEGERAGQVGADSRDWSHPKLRHPGDINQTTQDHGT